MVNKNVLVHISFKDACEVHAHACYKRNVSYANEEKTCCAYHKSISLMVLNSEIAPFTEHFMVIDGNFINNGHNVLGKNPLGFFVSFLSQLG